MTTAGGLIYESITKDSVSVEVIIDPTKKTATIQPLYHKLIFGDGAFRFSGRDFDSMRDTASAITEAVNFIKEYFNKEEVK